ncbi:MAG: YkoF family thiamine/hydroxymethylpyrimidine-binding protein [Sulfurovum sp.]
MEISVDISLYPLQEGYEKPILAFIAALEKEQSIDVVRNELSTQVHGDYHTIMQLLEKEILSVFDEIPHSIFVMKLVGNNRKGIY